MRTWEQSNFKVKMTKALCLLSFLRAGKNGIGCKSILFMRTWEQPKIAVQLKKKLKCDLIYESIIWVWILGFGPGVPFFLGAEGEMLKLYGIMRTWEQKRHKNN